MGQQLSIDTEKVSTAVNRIGILTSDVKSRTDAFVAKLQEQNDATGNKWALITSLQKKLEEEQKNVSAIIDAQESIKTSLNKYAAMAEEANDDSAFNG